MPRKAKRNAQGGGTIRQRPDGRWEARYTVGRDPGTGKQVQKSIYGDTQSDARKKLQAVTMSIDNGTYTPPTKMKVSQWLKIWLDEYVAPSVKPLTLSSYQNHVNKHLIPAFGAIELQALKAPQIQHLYNSLLRGSKEAKPLAPKTIKNLSAVIHEALGQAVKLGYIAANPASVCELPRVEKKEIKPLEHEEISEFLSAIEGEWYKNLFTVTLFTGMRQGEVLGLSWSNIDFEKGQITISQQLQKARGRGNTIISALDPLVSSKKITQGEIAAVIKAFTKGRYKSNVQDYTLALEKLVTDKTITTEQCSLIQKSISALEETGIRIDNDYYLASTKSGKARTITPAPFIMQTIRAERAKQSEHKLIAGPSWNNIHNLVFTDELGNNLALSTVYKNFKRVAGSVGTPNARFHDLRHTYATAALSNGDDIKTVQTNLGHATASFTLDVYGHASEKMKQDSADRMQRYIMEVKKQA